MAFTYLWESATQRQWTYVSHDILAPNLNNYVEINLIKLLTVAEIKCATFYKKCRHHYIVIK